MRVVIEGLDAGQSVALADPSEAAKKPAGASSSPMQSLRK